MNNHGSDPRAASQTPPAGPGTELEQLRQQFDYLARLKDELVGVVSHELRTPLVTGLGYLEMLIEGRLGKIPPRAVSRMQVALTNLQWLSQKIDDAVTYYRAIDPRVSSPPPVAGRLELEDLLPEVVGEVLGRGGRDPARLKLELADPLPAARGDDAIVRRVVAQLVDNALRHAGPQALITVSAAVVDDGRSVQVIVRDNGIGIDPAIADRLLVEREVGSAPSGLGLPLAQLLLRRLGSAATLQTAPGQGVAVSFSLPVW